MITLTILFLIAWVLAAILIVNQMKKHKINDPLIAIHKWAEGGPFGVIVALFFGSGAILILMIGASLIIKYLP
jgi:hypothetical protein